MNKINEDRIKEAMKKLPLKSYIYYEGGKLWIDGLRQSDSRAKLYASTFGWKESDEVRGLIDFSDYEPTFEAYNE